MFSVFPAQKSHFKDSLDAAVKLMYEEKNTESIQLLERLSQKSEIQKDPKQNFLVANNIGINYFQLLDYGEALRYYQEAFRIAVDHFDEESEMIVVNNIGFLYFKNKQLDEAEKYFLRASEIAKSKNNTHKIAMYAVNLAMLYNRKNQLPKASEYLEIAKFNNNSDERIKAEYENLLIENYYLSNRFDEAEKLAQQFLINYKSIDYNDLVEDVYLNLSKIELSQKHFPESKSWLEKFFNLKPNIEKKMEGFEILSKIEFQTGNYQKAIVLKDSILVLSEKYDDIKNGKIFALNKSKLEQKDYQNQIDKSENKLRTQQIVFLSIAVIFLLLVWALWNYSTKLKQKKIIAEKNQKIVELQLEQQNRELQNAQEEFQKKENEVLQEKEFYQNKAEESGRKLVSQDVMIQNTHQIIDDFIESLQDYENLDNIPQLQTKISNVKKKLVQKEDQTSFLKHYEDANPRFIQNLHKAYPQLNANDYRFLIYLSMNLSLKEIASIFNISIEACKKRKERISKKMEITNTDLYSHLLEMM